LIEWNFDYGNTVGVVAWAVRELGALAFIAGDLDNAEAKFTRAHEMYAEDAEDASVAREHAECHVLLGRVRRAQGDDDAAQHWFKQASNYLTDEAAEEVQSLMDAVQSGKELPEPAVLKIGESGLPIWESTEFPPSTTQPDIPA
jgi:tetratricopeptide (TPR) repeat protein